MTLVNTVREMRRARGWTQAELARRVRVSRQAVIAIERRDHNPSLTLAMRIAGEFGTTVDRVFTDGGGPLGA